MIYNITPIEFHTLFETTIEPDIISSLSVYNLLANNIVNLKNQETKRLISYFIVYHIIKKIKESKIDKNVVVVQPFILNNINISNYCTDTNQYTILYQKIIKNILKILQKAYPNNLMILKRIMDIKAKDTMEYIFNKSNQFRGGCIKDLLNFTNNNFKNNSLSNSY